MNFLIIIGLKFQSSPRKNITGDPDRAVKYPGVVGEEVVLTCWSQVGGNGWCGTCLETAGPGEPGHCGAGVKDPDPQEVIHDQETAGDDDEEKDWRSEAEEPRPSPWGGWGFCDSYCTPDNYQGYDHDD